MSEVRSLEQKGLQNQLKKSSLLFFLEKSLSLEKRTKQNNTNKFRFPVIEK